MLCRSRFFIWCPTYPYSERQAFPEPLVYAVTYIGNVVQIELLMRYNKYPQALTVLRQLCVTPETLNPPPKGLSQGLTGRPSAWQALTLLANIAQEPGADDLTLYHLSTWLLTVRVFSHYASFHASRPLVKCTFPIFFPIPISIFSNSNFFFNVCNPCIVYL